METNDLVNSDPPKKKNKSEVDVTYAGFYLRLFAWLIDSTIFFAPFILVSQLSNNSDNSLLKHFSPIIILFGFYNALGESSNGQATFGKRVFKLRVITNDGNKLTFKQAYYRYGASLFSLLALGFGIWAMFDNDKKQTWHDQLLNSYVIVDKKVNPKD